MEKKETKRNTLKEAVFNTISGKATKNNPINAKDLCSEYQITFRELKQLITELRTDYPIVSKETNGGGYWLAENEQDIVEFINMIDRRRRGYEETIKMMQKFMADYGNIPFID